MNYGRTSLRRRAKQLDARGTRIRHKIGVILGKLLLIGIIVPAGLLIWLNIWRYRVRLDKDLKTIVKNNCDIQERIKTTF